MEVEHARQQRLENAAAAKERLLITENLIRKQDKVQQLMARFNSLMEERRYHLAEETAAAEAEKILPDNPVPMLATWDARLHGLFRERHGVAASLGRRA